MEHNAEEGEGEGALVLKIFCIIRLRLLTRVRSGAASCWSWRRSTGGCAPTREAVAAAATRGAGTASTHLHQHLQLSFTQGFNPPGLCLPSRDPAQILLIPTFLWHFRCASGLRSGPPLKPHQSEIPQTQSEGPGSCVSMQEPGPSIMSRPPSPAWWLLRALLKNSWSSRAKSHRGFELSQPVGRAQQEL